MLELNFDIFPTLETERLLLRKITMDDEDAMFLLRTEINATKHLNMPFFERTRQENMENMLKIVNGVQNNELIGWAVTIKDDPKLMGTVSFHKIDKAHYRAEIGYMISPSLWGKGLMGEAVRRVIAFGFEEVKLHSIEAHVNPENQSSIQLLERNRFVKEGYFKENYFFKGTFIDTEVYSLVKGQ